MASRSLPFPRAAGTVPLAVAPRQLGRYDWGNSLGVFAYSSASLALPVLLLAMMLDFGIPLQSGGKSLAASLILARNSSITLSLIFSGFASLYWGNRRCLRFAMLLSGSFLGLAAASSSYWVLLLALLFAGIGEGLMEGLLTPFVEELHHDEPENCHSYVNWAHSAWPAGVISTTLAAGLLQSQGLHWRWILAGVAILYCLPFALLAPPKVSRKIAVTTETGSLSTERHGDLGNHRQFLAGMSQTLSQTRQILYTWPYWRFSAAMFLAGGAEISLSFWAASFVQLHYGSSAFIGGLSTALFALGMLVGRMALAHYLPARYIHRALLFSAQAGIFASVFLLFSSRVSSFLLPLFLSGLSTAAYWPLIQVYTVQRFPELNRTLLFILLSASGVPGAGFFPWVLGLISDYGSNLATALSFPNTFVLSLIVLPLCHLSLFFLLLRR